jgi:hypothetical protein
MSRSIRRLLLPAVVLLGLAVLAPATARAAKWSVHIGGHFPGHHATFMHRGYYPPGHVYHPHWYSHYPVWRAAYVYRAPVVVVRRPAVGFWFGPVPPPRAVPMPRPVPMPRAVVPPPPPARYHVW